MNKTSIKVIKRKDVPTLDIHTTSGGRIAPNEAKMERHNRREMVNTVANWISEKREKSRVEEMSAIRKIFGGEPLMS